MLVARRHVCSLRRASVARRHCSAASMEKRDYAVRAREKERESVCVNV